MLHHVPTDQLRPRVRAFYSIPDQAFIAPEEVETGGGPAIDPILQMERGAYWFGPSWRAVLARVQDGSDPAPSDFLPARPYVAIGGGSESASRRTLDALRRRRWEQRG